MLSTEWVGLFLLLVEVISWIFISVSELPVFSGHLQFLT